jgi:tRNA threonylcarbamoyladenosine modification (KEOPS) complex Cgi121 subunit
MFMRKRNGCELDYPVGEAVRMFGTEQDIAKRKTTEIVLRKSDFNLSC